MITRYLISLPPCVPSSRGELEITDVNRRYLEMNQLFKWKSWGAAWHGSIPAPMNPWSEASQFIGTIEKRQGLKVACPEEIAWRLGWYGARRNSRATGPARC